MTQAVSKQTSQAQQQQQLQQQDQHARDSQTEEHHKSASASVIAPFPPPIHLSSISLIHSHHLSHASYNHIPQNMTPFLKHTLSRNNKKRGEG